MTLFENLEAQRPSNMTKTAFAGHIGVSQGRVSQMVADGLPVLDNGRVPLDAAEAWYNANIRQKAEGSKRSSDQLAALKIERETAQRDLLLMDVERRRGQLINRREVELALHDRARAERDAHMAWISRVAPIIAAELGVELSHLYAVLDRELRSHLQELSETPLAELLNDA